MSRSQPWRFSLVANFLAFAEKPARPAQPLAGFPLLMKVLVTGGAGFIGSHTTERLLSLGHEVAILDCFNDYYNPAIKRANVRAFQDKVQIFEDDLRDAAAMDRVVAEAKPDAVIHLAARAESGLPSKLPSFTSTPISRARSTCSKPCESTAASASSSPAAVPSMA